MLVRKELFLTAPDIEFGQRDPAANVEDFEKLERGEWVGGAEAEADEDARAEGEDAYGDHGGARGIVRVQPMCVVFIIAKRLVASIEPSETGHGE